MRLGAVVAATLAIVATWSAPARADDASLWRAYSSQEREVTRATDAFVKASDRFSRRPSVRRAKAVIRADGRMIRVLRELIKGVAAEDASSDSGATAKQFALKGLREWRDVCVYTTRTMRAFIHRDRAAVRRWGRRAIRVGKRSEKDIAAAEKAFKDAGYSYPASQKRLVVHA